jgi:hypothetical protein
MRRLLRDLKFHAIRTWCVLFGHREMRFIGDFTRRGFKPLPAYQCPRCTEVVIKMTDAARLLGKKASVR